jgi:hypothetical protein
MEDSMAKMAHFTELTKGQRAALAARPGERACPADRQISSLVWAAAHQRQRAASPHRIADRRRAHIRDFLFISSAALAA